jgi:hypothetical protein
MSDLYMRLRGVRFTFTENFHGSNRFYHFHACAEENFYNILNKGTLPADTTGTGQVKDGFPREDVLLTGLYLPVSS